MKAFNTRSLPEILLATILCCALAAFVSAGSAEGNGAEFTPFQAADDWDFADLSMLIPHLAESVSCAGAELSLDFQQPCPPGANIKIRDLTAPGVLVSTDPRMTGMVVYAASTNFDPNFSGPVWGTWSLYVEGDVGVWDGTWSGQRRLSMDMEECLGITPCWIGELKLVGHGTGGIVEGLQVKATEIVRTFSPLPAPYENVCLMAFGGPCFLEAMPEGILSGRILEPGR